LKELAKRREIERIKIKNNNFKTNRNNGTGKHRTPLLPSNLPAAPSNTPMFIARIPNHPANFNPSGMQCDLENANFHTENIAK
jgi:hypothetical protein